MWYIVEEYEFFSAEESTSLHIRKKRVIDKTRNGGSPIQLSMAPYIVNILKNERSHCAGVILDIHEFAYKCVLIRAPLCSNSLT